MAAFAAGVKIDAFAYLPVQDFGNAFSIFVAQNFGAGASGRIRRAVKGAALTSAAFSLAVSLGVFLLAEPLMGLFIDRGEAEVIAEGVRYLRIEGAFYCLIGLLFLSTACTGPWETGHVCGAHRGVPGDPGGPGLRALRHPGLGVLGIWWSVPIGWFLADALGAGVYLAKRKKLVP